MYELGITAGCGNGNYCPNDSVTRGEMAVFIIKMRYGLDTFTVPAPAYFTDVTPASTFYSFIQRMALDGITSGCGANLYCPDGAVTRGQMAVFMMRGAFNTLLPAGDAVIASATPNVLPIGTAQSFNITGVNTHFAAGQTRLVLPPDITGSLTVTSATSVQATLTAATGATARPEPFYLISGSEEAVLPNGLLIQQSTQ